MGEWSYGWADRMARDVLAPRKQQVNKSKCPLCKNAERNHDRKRKFTAQGLAEHIEAKHTDA